MRIINAPVWLALTTLLGGCQSMEGERDGDMYYAPAAAYAMDLGINTFRGGSDPRRALRQPGRFLHLLGWAAAVSSASITCASRTTR